MNSLHAASVSKNNTPRTSQPESAQRTTVLRDA